MYNQEEEISLRWLSNILDIIRKECPWDKVQTTESLRYLTIEEVYELSDAIVEHQFNEEKKELGDIFMHLLFYAKLAEDKGLFTTKDVIDGICQKLISRHPHIALPDRNGNITNQSCHDRPKWEEIKMKEGRKSVLEGVPKSLPSLIKAIRLQEKTAGLGFEFPNSVDAFNKVTEEQKELQEALEQHQATPLSPSTKQHLQEEFGDMLFALVNWGRMLGINADDALSQTNQKYQQRFRHIEESASKMGHKVSDLSLEEMMALWNEAKKIPQHTNIEGLYDSNNQF